MGKIKFVSNEGNFTAKGYVLNEVYETGPRTESGKNPGKFFYSVKGKNVAGLNEWETNLFLYFKFPSGSEEANQANAYLAILKGSSSTPAAVAPVAQVASVTQVAPVTETIVQPVAQAVTPVAEVKPSIQELHGAIRAESKDILLAGLARLDFGALNISILKTDGKITLSIIMDGMPPLAINSGDIAAESVLKQIVSTFSESAQIVSTIRQWRKELSMLQADLAQENVVTKAKVEEKKKRTAKVKEEPVVETAIPNEPIEAEPANPGSEPAFEPAYMDDGLDMAPAEGVYMAEKEPEEAEGNGLDADVDEFQLK